MIDVRTRIHDAFAIEFKLGFLPDGDGRQADFTVGMWMFLPDSLDINASTYPKDAFYRDLKSNVRLITPEFSLDAIVSGDAVPLRNVLDAPEGEYEHRLKMMTAIARCSIRDKSQELAESDEDPRWFCDRVWEILQAYDRLREGEARESCREFLCNTAIHQSCKILEKRPDTPLVEDLIRRIDALSASLGYERIDTAHPDSRYVYRQGVLKKYVEHHLWLKAPKKRDGVLAEQAYFSIAAGMAMIFATVVAWAFQRTFGNLTWPLFIALIISYMMKDRIKELMRYYFSHRVGSRYFDRKAIISYKDRKLGYLKESCDFVDKARVPAKVLEVRNDGRRFAPSMRAQGEKVLLYRKKVRVDAEALSEGRTYKYSGVNDITRIQMGSFLLKMDNPTSLVEAVDDAGCIVMVDCPKDYHINIVLQCVCGDAEEFTHFRVTLARDGIQSIVKI